MFSLILNYVVWFISVFMAVVWILVLFSNRSEVQKGRKPTRLPTVSVLIPAYNEEQTIGKAIRSVLSLDYPTQLLDVIVIDDASTDRTGKIARRFAKQERVRVLTNRTNRGKAYSLNRALRIAKGEFIACVDADSRVERRIIKKMVGYFDDSQVACVTPALKVWRHRNLLERIQYAEYLLNVFLRKMLALLDAVHVTPGVFSMYRTAVIRKTGGFEEGNLTEDMEIALRLHKAGYKIENAMQASSYTLCPDKWKTLFQQRIRWYRGAIQNSLKYREMFFNRKYGNIGVFFLPLNFLSVFAITAIFLLMGYNVISFIANMVWKLSLVNWDVTAFIGAVDAAGIASALVEAFASPILFAIFGMAIGGYLLHKSFTLNNTKVSSYKKGYLLYLVVFPFILMAFWALAVFHEVTQRKRKW